MVGRSSLPSELGIRQAGGTWRVAGVVVVWVVLARQEWGTSLDGGPIQIFNHESLAQEVLAFRIREGQAARVRLRTKLGVFLWVPRLHLRE